LRLRLAPGLPLEQYVRDAKIDTLYEGTTAMLIGDLRCGTLDSSVRPFDLLAEELRYAATASCRRRSATVA
jgi:hypothetical protein